MNLGLILLAAGLVTGQYAPQRQGTDPLDAEREARVHRLGKGLRCPMCQGQSIADSPAPAARAQLDKVRELVAAGRSDAEVESYFVDRYGEWALLKPKPQGSNLLLWLLPGMLLLAGLWIILTQVKRAPTPGAPSVSPPKADDDYLAQVRNDVDR
ncbi:MAG: cytochrome c-type biogenesis protein CcmH [Myxococcaceae bacterium]|nr:cytochrome c-type biogenesis protein CcmH [Myxococcaceae bacterium]